MGHGHRKRLREVVENAGLDNLSLYQKMEYILYYVLPRVNTTEIAHELIDTYGSIHSVLDAPLEELENIKGLGPTSAKKLTHIVQILQLYNESKVTSVKNISNLSKAARYFTDLLKSQSQEYLYIVSLSPKGEMISYKKISSDLNDRVTTSKSEIFRYATSNKAKKIFLCHNHPNDDCTPSFEDDKMTEELKKILNSVGIELTEHIIVGQDGVFSFKNGCVTKEPFDNVEIVDYTIPVGQKDFQSQI